MWDPSRICDATARAGEHRCGHLVIGVRPLTVSGLVEPCRVSDCGCGFAETLVDVDGCGFVLAYGPDGGLVTARDCTPERYRTRCEPALKAAFDREDAARSPEVAAHPDVERRERVAAIRALAVAQTTRARELGDRAGRLRRATADACVHAMRLCRFAAEVIGPGARDAREQAFDAAAPA